MKNSDSSRYLENWNDELNASYLYEALSKFEENQKLAEIYRRMASTERGHAQTWAEKLKGSGAQVPSFRPSFRTKMLIWLARRFGVGSVVPTLAAIEDGATTGYSSQSEAEVMSATEQSHARLLRQADTGLREGMPCGPPSWGPMMGWSQISAW
jgi:hypothetical protein